MAVSIPVRFSSQSINFRIDYTGRLTAPRLTLPSPILTAYRSRGLGAGPLSTLPSMENLEEWQGHRKLPAFASQWYAHPRCVHCGAYATTTPSGFLRSQALVFSAVTFQPSTRLLGK